MTIEEMLKQAQARNAELEAVLASFGPFGDGWHASEDVTRIRELEQDLDGAETHVVELQADHRYLSARIVKLEHELETGETQWFVDRIVELEHALGEIAEPGGRNQDESPRYVSELQDIARQALEGT